MPSFKSTLPMGIYEAPPFHENLNYSDRSKDAVIDTIVIHYTVENFASSFTILTADRGVSSHYLIREDGVIYRLVTEDKKAWHAGVSNWAGKEGANDFSIGIELVNPGSGTQDCFPTYFEKLKGLATNADCTKNAFPEKQIDSLMALIKDIIERHEIKHIVGHSDVSPGRKIDPGALFPWQTLANNGIGKFTNITNREELNKIILKPTDENDDVLNLKLKLKEVGYKVTSNDTIFNEELSNVVRAFKFHFVQDNEVTWDEWDSTAELRLIDLLSHNLDPFDPILKTEL